MSNIAMSSFVNRFKRNVLLARNTYLNVQRLEHDGLQSSHKVNNLEKRFLVWTKKYKTVEEVPAYVTQSTMERARNRMRIRIANYMMAATLVGCIAMVILGKGDAKRGESVAKQNLEWHKQMNAKLNEKQ